MCEAPSSLGASCYCALCSQTRDGSVEQTSSRHRRCLKAEYGLGQPIPQRLVDLLIRLKQRDDKVQVYEGLPLAELDVLRVECTKCDRKGRYHVHKLTPPDPRSRRDGHSRQAHCPWLVV